MIFTITLRQLAKATHVSPAAVSKWRRTYGKNSNCPFPEPVAPNSGSTGSEPAFEVRGISEWLAQSQVGKNPDAALDLHFYSSAYAALKKQPVEAATALLSLHGDLSSSTLESLTEAARLVSEAAFGPTNVLSRLTDDVLGNMPGALREEFADLCATAIADAIVRRMNDDSPGAKIILTPWGEHGLRLLVHVVRLLPESMAVTVMEAAESQSEYDSVAYSELYSLSVANIEYSEKMLEAAFVIGSSLPGSSDTPDFFTRLEELIDCLGPQARFVLVSSAPLLTEETESKKARNQFTAPAESGHIAPLRYSSRLPRGIFVSYGQLQGALWLFSRPENLGSGNAGDTSVVVADHSGLSGAEHRLVGMDWTIMLADADSCVHHVFLHGIVRKARDTWRRGIYAPPVLNTVGPLPATAAQLEAKSRSSLNSDVVTFEDVIDDQALIASTTKKRMSYLSWSEAEKASSGVIQRFQGTRLDPELPKETPSEAPVYLIGKEQVLGNKTWNADAVGRLELTRLAPKASLTQPGDVIFIKTPSPRAVVDWAGGHLVTFPAQYLRCRSTRGRSRQPLVKITSPALLAAAINKAQSSDLKSWFVPVVPRRVMGSITELQKHINARRELLEKQLRDLDDFETQAMVALATESVVLVRPVSTADPP